MALLTWILVGTIIGWGTGKILKGNGYGPFMDVGMGIFGALTAGFLISTATLGGHGGTILTTMVAMTGAALVTGVVAMINGRRLHARQL